MSSLGLASKDDPLEFGGDPFALAWRQRDSGERFIDERMHALLSTRVFLSCVRKASRRALTVVPFPVEAVRDLLGVTRLLRAATADPGQALDLQRVEHELAEALRLAERQPAKAWDLADRAALDLGALIGPSDSALGMIIVASKRIAMPRTRRL